MCSPLQSPLLTWYRATSRPLPWRQTRDPYLVWVSEVMLQQTRVATVLDYYPRFIARFPTPSSLASAPEPEILSLWSGLGYYSRARQLRRAATRIVSDHGGVFPATRREALALPGVGPYTAGAVLSIAHDLPEPVVDGNVGRVFCRLFAIEGDPKSSAIQRQLWRLAGDLVPKDRGAGEWNQALMELGATVCTAKSPGCASCPVASQCVALAEGRVDELPTAGPRPATVEVSLEILLVRRNGRLLFERRGEGGPLAGMWQLPTRELPNSRGETSGLFPARWPRGSRLRPADSLGELRHAITRHSIRAELRRGELGGPRPADWRWLRRDEWEARGLSGLARKSLALVSGPAPTRAPQITVNFLL